MVIQPKVRGFICTTAHPSGCSENVKSQINYIKQQPAITGAKNVLIIGASTGYGLATRIAASVACGANTIGVAFEKAASDKRTASAGWYNTAAFENLTTNQFTKTIIGDAFSEECKALTIAAIKELGQPIDLVIYSVASPRRTDPSTGEVYNSTLKTIGQPFRAKTVNPLNGEVSEVQIDPANDKEVADTIAVMGGNDWQRWIMQLQEQKLLAKNVITVSYSYIGPELTYPIYRAGTIGKAKEHLEITAKELTAQLQSLNGQALVAVNKAVVTQSSAAIPVVPLYISLLFKVMKEKNIHEDCIEQMYRLLQKLYLQPTVVTDEKGLIRLDDLEMRADVQAEVAKHWQNVTSENLSTISDIEGYRHDFYRLFGFGNEQVNYEQDVNAELKIKSIA